MILDEKRSFCFEQEAIILEVPDSPHLIQTQSESSEEEKEKVVTTQNDGTSDDTSNETANNGNETEETATTSSEITDENERSSAAIHTFYEVNKGTWIRFFHGMEILKKWSRHILFDFKSSF